MFKYQTLCIFILVSPAGDVVLELPDECTLELVWKNNERQKEYVLVRSKDLEFDEDPGSATETSRAGHFTLEQCLNLFTKPEVLAPEEAWYEHTHLRVPIERCSNRIVCLIVCIFLFRYCPKCQQHREASKQLLLWRLPNVLIIQLKRFSFRSFIWRDKINDMVDFPVRYTERYQSFIDFHLHWCLNASVCDVACSAFPFQSVWKKSQDEAH